MTHNAASAPPTRAQIDALPGATLIEFGAQDCGHCRRAQPLIAAALEQQGDGVRHIQVEDGPGQRLGRTFQVKLWPTLIFFSEGREVARLVRPSATGEIVQALGQMTAAR
ncbi:thioredoxin family protein [Phytopseudomonas dryadis]|uniref:Thiol reductase thioredoxin n=1 Tax=Phytopseudomonas dryadis TaxID=2487520 RepID=A0A4Q9R9V7_9GAMM|nr:MULTISPECIES: thioredoxin family protein [Pseudomonas]TBU96970.1 thiol reductase thioredoxin [Pseudomonas dryadis]TBU99703.1 thiol reductase thioredoxin [Pseudomonas dryadis]TBV12686.1 thiol reductase thioredoxin [Pseudomonas sp. FRB 230]